MARKQLRLCIVAKSGCGKSTAAKLMVQRFEDLGLRATIHKLAEPLYEIQSVIYRKAGHPIEFYQQDQLLLEEIATAMRRIDPESLVRDFLERITGATEDVILNDDLRDADTDAPRLRTEGFRILRIVAPESVRMARLGKRQDLATVSKTPLDAQLERISADWELENGSDALEQFEHRVHRFVDRMLETSSLGD